MFNFKKTKIYQAILTEPIFSINKAIKAFSFGFFSLSVAGYIFYAFAQESNSWILPISALFFSILIISICIDLFFESYVKRNKVKTSILKIQEDSSVNLADYLDFSSAKYFLKSLKGDKFISLSSLLYNFLDIKNKKIAFIFSRLMINIDFVKGELKGKSEENMFDIDLFISEVTKSTIKRGGDFISEGDLICALSGLEPNFKKMLIEMSVKKEDMENVNWWAESLSKRIDQSGKFWEYENLIKTGSIGGDWAAGWTPTLDRYSIQWSGIVGSRGYEEVIGYQEEISMLEDYLAKKGNKNALIVGEIGSGRKNIIHSLIRKSFTERTLPEINNKKFIELDLISLASSIESFEKAEATIGQCFDEAVRAGNIILIINNFHEFLGGGKAGIVDISGIIIPYISNPRLQLICITTYAGLHQKIESKPGIMQLFSKIEVSGLSKDDALLILEDKALSMESQYGKFISYQAIKEIVLMTEKYIATPLPEKAINLLEDVFSYASSREDFVIDVNVIDTVLTKKIQIPVGALGTQEKTLLLDMEKELHQRVIGQNDAIIEISAALRRSRAGVQTRKGPMGSFLFLGPTGVGKTETAKALADIYFGSEEKMIRLDMSEFQRPEDVVRLIGSETQEGILTTKVRETPFSLVLLDEIEKAYPDVLNLFLQVLDEGNLSDNFGQKVSFLNTLVIATSNAGYQIILDSSKEGKGGEEIKEKLLDNIFEKGLFRPEFINRFDGTIVFNPLTQDDLMMVAELQLGKLKKRLAEKEINFIVTDALKLRIVELSYNPAFGAREMKRVIQNTIEDGLAQAFLADKIKNGATLEIDPEQFNIIIQNPL